ncbi:MAG: hypothetical protein R6U58_01940 [Bacteroidales bacterium]
MISAIYRKNSARANFSKETFENIGHEQPEIIKKEVVEFFIRESEM